MITGTETSLAAALGVMPWEIVSFVGAGGKTSAMVRLAWELAKAGKGVVFTTTTHILEPLITQTRVILLETDEQAIMEQLPGLVRHYRIVALASGYAHDPWPNAGESPLKARKLRGVSPDLVGRIASLPGIDYILVEADGARGRSLKAPADHEPVIPASTTLLVPVAALDIVGRPLDPAWVHRPERLAALCHLAAGQTVSPAVVAAILAHPQGGLKGCPPGARVVPFLNKAETPAEQAMAADIAAILLRSSRIHHVVAGTAGVSGGGPTDRPRYGHIMICPYWTFTRGVEFDSSFYG